MTEENRHYDDRHRSQGGGEQKPDHTGAWHSLQNCSQISWRPNQHPLTRAPGLCKGHHQILTPPGIISDSLASAVLLLDLKKEHKYK